MTQKEQANLFTKSLPILFFERGVPKKGWGVQNLGKIPKLFHNFFLRAMCRYIILVQTAELWQWVDVNLANIEGSHLQNYAGHTSGQNH